MIEVLQVPKNKHERKQEMMFDYEIGSNVICVNGVVKYLDIVIWDKTTYEDIESHIVK